jgi:FtsZ-binding cell division protein ZapB
MTKEKIDQLNTIADVLDLLKEELDELNHQVFLKEREIKSTRELHKELQKECDHLDENGNNCLVDIKPRFCTICEIYEF